MCASVTAGPLEDGVAAAREKKFPEAEIAWTAALAQGSMDAAHNLAGLYLSGALGVPNFRRALELLQQAAAAGHPQSLVSLGYVYQNGIGTNVDSTKAADYFRQAAELGLVEGKFRFAEILLKSTQDSATINRALAFIEEASKAGYPPALHAVGDMLRHGAFVVKNTDRALEFYKSASNGGYAESAFTIADMYLNGTDVHRDISVAIHWLKTAAQLGSSEASYVLGYLHSKRKSSSPEDLSKAAEYFKSAANNWHEKAQVEYAALLLAGKGTQRNLIEAYKWVELAASTGYEEAHYLRATLATEISVADMALARKRAQNWFEQNHIKPHKHRNNTVVHVLK